MNIKKVLISTAVGALMLGSAITPSFAASIVSNGSFENGTDPGLFTTVNTGDTNIDNWSVVSGNVDYIGTYWQSADGNRSIDMNGSTAGSISQTVPTVNGAVYALNFAMSGNPACGPSLKTLNVDTGGSPTTFTYDTSTQGNTLTDMKWVPNSLNFTASGSTTPITFTSGTVGFCGPALDSVSVSQVLPTDKDQCKKGGWQTFGVFKNQGDCVSFVATGGKNPPANQ